MTLGALEAILDAGLRVPEDISLVAFDDPSWTTLLRPRAPERRCWQLWHDPTGSFSDNRAAGGSVELWVASRLDPARDEPVEDLPQPVALDGIADDHRAPPARPCWATLRHGLRSCPRSTYAVRGDGRDFERPGWKLEGASGDT